MVDLGGYVIILVETNDKRVKLYGEENKRFLVLISINVHFFQDLQQIKLILRLLMKF